ncbi:MAG: glycosyltransferase [Burkholderiales bacterium]
MLLSGLMVTRAASRPFLAEAIGDFARQTLRGPRELVIVHDGDAEFGRSLGRLAAAHGVAGVVERAAPGQALGALRNRCVHLARGELVAQWDDDDRHHPCQLELLVAALRRERAAAAFATEQIHWFRARGVAYWEDWSGDAWPLDVVQGTLVARRAALPAYDEVVRGEDSRLVLALARAGARVARVPRTGWSYVYTFHGGNAWDVAHHALAAAHKRLSAARFAARAPELAARLREYVPPLPALVFPSADDVIGTAAQASAGRKRRASTA